MFRSARGHLTVDHLVVDEGGIAGDLAGTSTAMQDARDFVVAGR